MPVIETHTRATGMRSDWTPARAWLDRLIRRDAIAGDDPVHPCGCNVKLDLREVVYPVLEDLGRTESGIENRRVDAHISPGRLADIVRLALPHHELLANPEGLAERLVGDGCDSIIELFLTADAPTDEQRRSFARVSAAKAQLLRAASAAPRRRGRPPIVLGKGHSIAANVNHLVLDCLTHDLEASGCTLSNNDTIIAADSQLRPESPLTALIAMNNALNDLFLMGVDEELLIVPVYDGSDTQIAEIRAGFDAAVALYREKGVDMTLRDMGPLGLGFPLVGATVVGHTQRAVPSLDGLEPGMELLVTRPLGDLSILDLHHHAHLAATPHEAVDELRIEALLEMATSNWPVAHLIAEFLPVAGEALDPGRHVVFTTDISGPGLSVLEAAASLSKVRVLIEELAFIHEASVSRGRRDHTASTNGPLVLGGRPPVIAAFRERLESIGFDACWRVGSVAAATDPPLILIGDELRARTTGDFPDENLFEWERYLAAPGGPAPRRATLFESYGFSAPRL